ncbi:hypothetical protein [Halobacteriovorax sp.]|uniref:hypothetical protein n=1 Tax=Halobacteriovorax sp. TaxID=2020862 RepID=UPI003AF2FE3C
MKKQNISTMIKIAILTGLIPLSSYASICTIVERKFDRKDFEKISDFDEEYRQRYEKYKERCDLGKYKVAEEAYQRELKKDNQEKKEHQDFIKDRESIEISKEDLRDFYDNSPIIAYRASLKYRAYNGDKDIYLQKMSDANAICQNMLSDKNAKAKTALVEIAEKDHMGQVETPVAVQEQLESRFDSNAATAAFTIGQKKWYNSGDNVEAGTVTNEFETSRKERIEFNADLEIRQASGLPSTFVGDIRALEFSKIECVSNPVNKQDKLDDIDTKTTLQTKVNSAEIDSDEDEQKVIVKFDEQERQNFLKQKGSRDSDDSNNTRISDIRRGQTTEKYEIQSQIDFLLDGNNRGMNQ